MQQREAFNLYRQRRFKKRFANYAIVNTVLTLVDLLGGGGLSWSLYILLFWGLGVAFDACNTYQTNTEEYEIAFQKWHRKHQIKETFNTVWNKFFIKA
jgi:hypothetical protein